MGPAKKFIDMLEEQGLLEEDIIAELRRQVSEARTRMTPEVIAKLLVENEQLTKFQATKLIAKLKESIGDRPPPSTSRTPIPEPPPPTASNELDLAPQDSNANSGNSSSGKGAQAAILLDEESEDDSAAIEEVEVIESVEVDVVEPEAIESQEVEEAVPRKRAKSKTNKQEKRSSSSADRSRKASSNNSKKKEKNPWDSFRVYGVLIILLVLLVPAIGLGIWLWKGNAQDLLVKSNDAYEGQDYDTAIEKYTSFVKKFPSNENASYAKVRIALSRIRKDTKAISDPSGALKTVKEVLPTVAQEKGLGTQRGDLAGALLTLAEKFNTRADLEKVTEEKKKLIASLDEHLEICRNPQYIGAQERNQNDSRIKRIEEDRERVLRDIMRSEDLVAALAGMRQALDGKEVTKAYGIRRDLVRKHVQLESEPQLQELLREATSMQQGLVTTGKGNPQLVTPPTKSTNIRSVALANRREGPGAKPSEGIVIVRVKRSLYGLNGVQGGVIWRVSLGADLQSDPKRVSNDPNSDAIVTLKSTGVIQRLRADNGEYVWRVSVEKPIHDPVIDRDEIFITSRDGGIFCLDAQSGQTKWSKQLPQPTDTGIGVGPGKPILYVVGDHSNLYALSRKDGSCREVFYLGHQSGAIKVPPVVALGHILAFDNAAPAACTLRIQSVDENGLNIKTSQPSMPLKGHTVVPPEAEGRRVAIATDLGEIAMLDIEPSKANDKVSRIAGRVTNESQPKLAWPLMDKNDLWVASSNLTLFEMQTSNQKLNSKLVEYEQDSFAGRPFKFGTHIIHTRILRGTMGVRVVAADAKDGKPAWETDLGVPVSWVHAPESIFPIQAITTQAAFYSIDREGMTSKPSVEVTENAGQNERTLLFRNPISLSDGRSIMVNQSLGNQWSFWDASSKPGNRLRKIALPIGAAMIGAEPIVAANSILVPLNNGQLQLLKPDTGKLLVPAYQPPLQPEQKHAWVGPTLSSDGRSILIADNTKRLYRIGIDPQMKVLVEKDFDKPLSGRLVSMGDVFVGVAKGAGDSIEFFSELDLQPVATSPLQGHIVWGPFAIDDRIIASSDSEGLIAWDKSGKKLWQAQIPGKVLVGAPLSFEGDLVLASANGTLVRMDGNGLLKGKIELGEAVSSTPFQRAGLLLVPGEEGVVLAVKGSEFTSGDQAAEVTR